MTHQLYVQGYAHKINNTLDFLYYNYLPPFVIHLKKLPYLQCFLERMNSLKYTFTA